MSENHLCSLDSSVPLVALWATKGQNWSLNSPPCESQFSCICKWNIIHGRLVCCSSNFIVGNILWLDWKVITSRYTETSNNDKKHSSSSVSKQMDQLVHGELQEEVEMSLHWHHALIWKLIVLRGHIYLKTCIYKVCHRTGMHISYRQRCTCYTGQRQHWESPIG